MPEHDASHAGVPSPAPERPEDHAIVARREALAAIWRWGKIVLRIAIPAFLLWLVWHELRHINVNEARARLSGAHAGWLILAALATGGGLLTMACYDALAFPTTPNLSTARRFRLGLLFFAWTNFLTLGPIGGPALRLYFYRRAGMPTRDIVRGLAGLYAGFLGGLAAWALASIAPVGSGAQGVILRALIAILVAPPLAALAGRIVAWFRKKPEEDAQRLPLAWIGLVGALDWGFLLATFALAGHSLGVSIPSDIAIRTVFLGQAAGIVGMTPGGLGSADAVWLTMLVDAGVESATAAAHVFVFRLVFYVAWVCSLLALYVILASGWAHAVRWQRRVLAGALLVNAGFLLASAATPAVASRLAALDEALPVDAIEGGHALSVVAALVMVFLSKGILKGYRSAFLFSAAALIASIVAHLLKAGDFEEAIVSAALLLLLLGARTAFTRKGRIPIGWELAGALTLGALAFFLLVGFASFHRPLTHHRLWDLLSTMEARAEASRFARAAVLLSAVGLAFVIRQASMPVRRLAFAAPEEIARADAFLAAHATRASARNVGSGDKAIWWWTPDPGAPPPRGLCVYQRTGDNMIVFCDPVLAFDASGEAPSAEDEKRLLDALHEHADVEDLDLVFYQITPHWMSRLHDFGCAFFKLGEEAVMNVAGFSLAGGESKSFRKVVNKCENAGVAFRVLLPPHSPETIAQAREVSDAWLDAKNVREMQFSLGYFSAPYLQRCPLGCAFDAAGRMVGFVNLLCGRIGPPPEGGHEATIDLMRSRPGVVDNLMDSIIIQSALWAAAQGHTTFSLGMSPLMDVGERRRASFTERLARLAFEHGERIYNYRGLHMFKEKFHPEWEPRFMAYQKPWDWAPTVIATTSLIKATSREARARIRAARVAP